MKKLSLFIVTPIILVVLAVVALLVFVDPNQFKPMLVEQTKKQTNLDLAIEGDIGWQFFPSIGFSLGKTTLSNPEGFGSPNMVKVDEVALDISVLPLLSKELQVGNVTLSGAHIYIETRADGSSNLDALTASTDSTEQDTQTTPPDSSKQDPTTSATDQNSTPWVISLKGANIKNAQLEIKDDKNQLYTKLEKVNLKVSSFKFDQWTPMTFSFSGVNNQQKFALSGKAEAKTDARFTDYQVRDVVLEGSFSQPDVDIDSFEVKVDNFKLDAWSNISLLAEGQVAGNQFDITSTTKAMLQSDLSTFIIQNLALATPLKGKDLNLESITLGLSSFRLGQRGAFQVAVKGRASDIDANIVTMGNLMVDQNIEKVIVDGLTVKGKVAGDALPQNPIRITVDSDVEFDLLKNKLSLLWRKVSFNTLQFDGTTDVELTTIPKVRFKMHSPNINVDEWSGGSNNDATDASAAAQPSSDSSEVATESVASEPDLSVLKTLDVAGSMSIDKLQASNAKLQKAFADIAIKDGVFNLRSLKANLYQGSIQAKARVNAKQPVASYDIDAKVNNVKVGPLLVDVADNNTLEGTGNIDLNLTGKSLIPDELKKHLAGTVAVKFADGAINGINVAQIIRTNYAKFKGEKVPAENEPKKTDFSAMDALVKLNKGVATLSNVAVASPLLRIKATGNANYLSETMDILSKTSIVGSLEGQGGGSIDDLADVTIPLRLQGSWTDPKVSLDLAALQKQELERNKKKLEEKAKKEAERGLKKLFGDNASNDDTKKMADSLLKKLF
ncbi:AsmA family protein [Vibrio ezurae]|uniref:Putative AsmA protein n=1 Tax=Vibrio ezurae NBRC 102218 TaxID=1219080 RepID=U3AG37_9VIBR|nr:AsmA family protein [Vibrio ezurae]GAD78866.1 putative AsmA protein [Vibrio ezurae NBRC 102218]